MEDWFCDLCDVVLPDHASWCSRSQNDMPQGLPFDYKPLLAMQRTKCNASFSGNDDRVTDFEALHIPFPHQHKSAFKLAKDKKGLHEAVKLLEHPPTPYEYALTDPPEWADWEAPEPVDGRREASLWIMDNILTEKEGGAFTAQDLNKLQNAKYIARWLVSDWVTKYKMPAIALWYHVHRWHCLIDVTYKQHVGVKIPFHKSALWKTPQKRFDLPAGTHASKLFRDNECALCKKTDHRVMYESSIDSDYGVCPFCIDSLSVNTTKGLGRPAAAPWIPLFSTMCVTDDQRQAIEHEKEMHVQELTAEVESHGWKIEISTKEAPASPVKPKKLPPLKVKSPLPTLGEQPPAVVGLGAAQPTIIDSQPPRGDTPGQEEEAGQSQSRSKPGVDTRARNHSSSTKATKFCSVM